MRNLLILIFGASLSFAPPPTLFAENIVKIPTRHDSYNEFIQFTQNFDPLSNASIPTRNIWRHLAEHLIFASAPTIGGCECTIELESVTADMNFIRTIREISEGRYLSFPVAGFPNDPIYQKFPVQFSEPILKDDEFFVGLFTHETREDILSLTDPDEIKKLTFVVVENWTIDLQVLQQRGFEIELAADWGSALRVIKAGRADVMLQPFGSGETMSFTDDATGETFTPIPNVKMAFSHSRNFMVSPNHPESEQFLKFLNAGIKTMRENGRLREYFIAAGVIDPRIQNFNEI